MKPRTSILATLSILAAFMVDQVTKMIVFSNAKALQTGIEVFAGFDLVFFQNDGVTFGMFAGVPWWGLTLLAIGICCWLIVLITRTHSRLEACAYGIIIGGALGNVIDRVRFGAVTGVELGWVKNRAVRNFTSKIRC